MKEKVYGAPIYTSRLFNPRFLLHAWFASKSSSLYLFVLSFTFLAIYDIDFLNIYHMPYFACTSKSILVKSQAKKCVDKPVLFKFWLCCSFFHQTHNFSRNKFARALANQPISAPHFFNPQQMLSLRVKLIKQGEKRETSTKNCNETMLRDKLKVFVSRISSPLQTIENSSFVVTQEIPSCHRQEIKWKYKQLAWLNRVLISKTIYKENCFSICCDQCSISLTFYFPFCVLPLAVLGSKHAHSLCVGMISHRSHVHQNVSSSRLFTSSFSLSHILRIRNTFWLKTVGLKISHLLYNTVQFNGDDRSIVQ